ncbi:MAG: hypothetical protein TECD_00305 [Hyphomicrobiaceae bacterium hypho_1]
MNDLCNIKVMDILKMMSRGNPTVSLYTASTTQLH